MKYPRKTLQNVKCAIILKYKSLTYNFFIFQKYDTLWSIFVMVMSHFIRHKPHIYLKSEKYSKSLLLSFYYPKYNGMCGIFLGTTSSKNVKAKSVFLWIKKVLLLLRIIPKICHISNWNFIYYFNFFPESPPPEATFRGTEYITYDLQLRSLEPILSINDELSLYFKTRKSSGLLFYTGIKNF